ncbi:HEPN domain-containing protein [Desulfobacterales bacterium HSG2]|nr:HEPN domain-containing protein [Desulfobacterales bacterium HSG2]
MPLFLSFRKHSGVRSAFHREFVRTGLLEVKYGKFYDQLFEDRQEGDYIAFVSFEADYAEHQLNQCVEFPDNLRPLISSLSE